jgi:predicted DNA-binding ribbon-helix-helix protein
MELEKQNRNWNRFFYMLDQIARHGQMDLEILVKEI